MCCFHVEWSVLPHHFDCLLLLVVYEKQDIVEELMDVSPTKLVAVGLFLGLPYTRMENCVMEADSHGEKIGQMVDLLLNKKYHGEFGEPSWKIVVTAVAADEGGGDRSLAKQIAENHPRGWSLHCTCGYQKWGMLPV